MKRCSTSLVIRTMQTETTILYDSTPIRRSKKIVITLNVDEKWRNGIIHLLLMRMQYCIAMLERVKAVSYITKQAFTM